MKYYIFILTMVVNLFGLEIFVNSGIENLEKYSILHLKNSEPFNCSSNLNEEGEIKEVTCSFDKLPDEKQFDSSKSQFFSIKREFFGDRFVIRIIPTQKSKLYQNNIDIKSTPDITNSVKKKSTHWFIVAYQDKLPFIQEQKSKGLNLPVDISSVKSPYIGALDIAKQPIFFNKNIDIGYYLDVKKYMKEEDYEKAIETVNEALANSPDTMFQSDFLLFKIRALSESGNVEDELLDLAKSWIKIYPSDEAVPEVLLIIAQAYIQMGIDSEARYYFDRILSEHPDNKFAKMAMIYMGDDKATNGDNKSAMKLYKDALYQTQDVKIASIAASRLAYKYLEQGDKDKAREFYEKVLKANPKYLVKNEFDGYKLAKEIGDKGLYSISKEIGDIIIQKIGDNKLHDIYENVLKDTAYWFEMDKGAQKAYELYNRYLNEFPFGDFVSFVNSRLDYVFFDMPEDNKSKLLVRYDELIEKYKAGEIPNKALYEKAKLLLDIKEYQKVLDLKDKVLALPEEFAPDRNDTINNAGVHLAIEFLKQKRCSDAVKLKREYKINFSNEYDKELAYCALDTTDYKLAMDLSERNLKTAKTQKDKLSWSKLYIRALVSELDLYKVIDFGMETVALADKLEDREGQEVLYDVFNAYMKLKKYNEAMALSEEVEKKFKNSIKNIDMLKSLLNYASQNNDDNLLLKYSKKIMDIQLANNSYIESPSIELTYMNSLMNLNKLSELIEFGKSMKLLDDENNVRLKYLMGTAYQKSGDNDLAKREFNECVKINAQSSWKGLCENGLKLINY